MAVPVLWQFQLSHYNEKVRWALDYKGIAHVRRTLLPGLHVLPILLRTGQKQVPVLKLDGRYIADSTRIIAALEEKQPQPTLYPSDPEARRRALDLEEYFDANLGPALRLAWFYETLKEPESVIDGFTDGVHPLRGVAFRTAFPLIRRIMAADMGIDERNAAAARAQVMQVLDRLEGEIQPNGYLVGDSFSIADLTAAALWSPLVRPPQFSYPFREPLPHDAGVWRNQLIDRPGLRWVANIFRRHRGASAAV